MNRSPLPWTDSTSEEEEVRELARSICRKLTTELSAMPPGVAEWAPAWDMVRDANARFIAELVSWEASPSDTTMHRVRGAYIDLRVAWGEAEFRYERERRVAW